MFGQVCHRRGLETGLFPCPLGDVWAGVPQKGLGQLETGLFLCPLGDVWAGVPQKGLEVQVVVFSLFPG